MSFTVDEGLVERVDEATHSWQQGDVLELPTTSQAWMAVHGAPLTSTSAAMKHGGSRWVVAATDRLVVVSQTCDIVRGCSRQPFVAVASVVQLHGAQASQARGGHRPRFVPLPALGDDFFADLGLLASAEKTVLLEAEPVRGLRDPIEQRRFALGVSRAFGRPAFPDDLHMALDGLVQRIKEKHDKRSHEGRALASLEEIRVFGEPSWAASQIDVTVAFCPLSRSDALEQASQEEWEDFVHGWMDRTGPHGVITSVDGDLMPLDEMAASDYLAGDPLDLDYLTSRTTSQR